MTLVAEATTLQSLGIHLERHESDTGVNYTRPKGEGRLLKYPSVTTLIDKYEDKWYLKKWENNIGKEAAQLIKTKSAVRGTHVHQAAEAVLYRKPLPALVADEQRFFDNLFPFLRLIVPLLSEERVYWEETQKPIPMGFAGTPDIVFKLDGAKFQAKGQEQPIFDGCRTVLGDFKTWNKMKYPSGLFGNYLQLAAYCGAINQRTQGYYKLNRAMIIGVTEQKLRLYYLNPEKIAWYWTQFVHLVECYFTNRIFDWSFFVQTAKAEGHVADTILLNPDEDSTEESCSKE